MSALGQKQPVLACVGYVRFTPESGHQFATLECPLIANNGHSPAGSGLTDLRASRSLTRSCFRSGARNVFAQLINIDDPIRHTTTLYDSENAFDLVHAGESIRGVVLYDRT